MKNPKQYSKDKVHLLEAVVKSTREGVGWKLSSNKSKALKIVVECNVSVACFLMLENLSLRYFKLSLPYQILPKDFMSVI